MAQGLDPFITLKSIAPFPTNYTKYHGDVLEQLHTQYEIASMARSKGVDPMLTPEPEIALDLADRVERLVKVPGLANDLRQHLRGHSKEEVALLIAEEVALGKFGFFDKERALDLGVRVGLAVVTDGITVAPIQGISTIKIKKNDDGTNYPFIYFAGPIRSAGGTEAAFSLVITDYIRKGLGLDKYRPTTHGDDEVGRFVEELRIYEREVGSFQFRVSDDDVRHALLHLPVEIDGVETDPVEVVVHRDMKRIQTDRVRGGALRVLNDGVIGRSKKLLKLITELSIHDWGWMEELASFQQKHTEETTEATHFEEVISGRPVLSLPKRVGGFRLRYGRGYNTGLSAVGLHPAVAVVLDYPFVIGTQAKLDTPSKAASVALVDTIEPPLVKLKDESVIRIEDEKQASELHDHIDRIIYLGDLLVSFGDFLENNVKLIPSGYVEEWWIQELMLAIKGKYTSIDKCAEDVGIEVDHFNAIINDPLRSFPSAPEAFLLSSNLAIPFHPRHLFFWDIASPSEIITLRQNLKISSEDPPIIYAPKTSETKVVLEKLAIPHRVKGDELLMEGDVAYSIMRTLALTSDGSLVADWKDVNDLLSLLAHVPIRRKSSIFLGLRIGRPEKAMPRMMRPPVHILFPVGIKGGPKRDLLQAAKDETVDVELVNFICTKCRAPSINMKCKCGGDAIIVKKCPSCGRIVEDSVCPACRLNATPYSKVHYPIKQALKEAVSKVTYEPTSPFKGVRGLTNTTRTPEPLEKGLLRQKYDLFVYKDGTTRFDATNSPLTHFRPSHIGTSIEKLTELGYKKDFLGKQLRYGDQLLELLNQDIILPIEAGNHLLKASKFVDELLTKLYGTKAYYHAKSSQDLIGHLVVGLAPHTSVGIVGRIIGFTKSQVCFAHPYWHAAKRRDCDGDEDSIILLLDVLLNFSKEFLPAQIGGLMDAPLLIQPLIIPREVDEQAHNLEVAGQYPLEFYEASMKGEHPSTLIKIIDIIKNRLNSKRQFYGFRFTHGTANISGRRARSTYSTLRSLPEKLDKQIELAMKINAVDPNEVVTSVLRTHILPDIIGNLKAYTAQSFRCKRCGKQHRRFPLKGSCLECGGELQSTVTRGSIEKYLSLGLKLSEKFEVGEYMRSRFKITSEELSSLFTKEKRQQLELTDFFAEGG